MKKSRKRGYFFHCFEQAAHGNLGLPPALMLAFGEN